MALPSITQSSTQTSFGKLIRTHAGRALMQCTSFSHHGLKAYLRPRCDSRSGNKLQAAAYKRHHLGHLSNLGILHQPRGCLACTSR